MHIRIGHSPDPDDAFMFYGLASGNVDTGPYEIEHVVRDIQTLNEKALVGELEVTALSFHAYMHVHDTYALTRCGGSFGVDCGPIIVARRIFDALELPHKKIAVPGELTTAFLLLRLIVMEPNYVVLPFDEILEAVADDEVDAGVIIHEGQLTYSRAGLCCVLDLGKWWRQMTSLPLPLGVNAVRRDLGEQVSRELTAIFKASIQYGLDHRAEAVEYAMKFARDMDEMPLVDKFVGMYVNELTVDCGSSGERGLAEMLRWAVETKVVDRPVALDFV